MTRRRRKQRVSPHAAEFPAEMPPAGRSEETPEAIHRSTILVSVSIALLFGVGATVVIALRESSGERKGIS